MAIVIDLVSEILLEVYQMHLPGSEHSPYENDYHRVQAPPFVQPLLPACSTEAMPGGSLNVSVPREGKPYTNSRARSSHHGSVETNLTSTYEDAGSILGLHQWVKDLALL